jgi:hypothetical protein
MPIVLKSGSLNLLEPSGPVQAYNGIVLLCFTELVNWLVLRVIQLRIITKLATCWSILRENLTVAQLFSNLPLVWDGKICNQIFKSCRCTCSEPDESIPCPAVLFLSSVSPICAKVPEWSFFLQVFTPKPCKHRLSLLLYACHMLPAHSQVYHILVPRSLRALCLK